MLGINGFGRIGRVFFRQAFEQLKIGGINDPSDAATLAHLLKYDSTHGQWPHEVGHDEHNLIVDGQSIPLNHHRDPSKIEWRQWGVQTVCECAGVFKRKADLAGHLQNGVQKIIYSAPFAEADITVVYGLNHQKIKKEHQIISNASCTTNCLAPVASVVHKNFGIEQAFMTTVHSYTNDQKILDASHKDLRRSRAAAVSMIPTTTGAAKAVAKVLPELKGRLHGMAVRVPTSNVSLVDLVLQSTKPVSVDTLNHALRQASQHELKNILQYETAPLVSCDFLGNPHSSVVDARSTQSLGSHMAKILAWYDNEVGFSQRMVDVIKYMEQHNVI